MLSGSSLFYRIRISKVNMKMKSSVRSVNVPLEIPKVDDRVYYQCILNNGISVTIVQDKTSEKSSCALSVKTGAMHDPLPGIAHITEHAVFLGSEKYPIENAYKNYLSQHGGGSNASTSMDQTTYKFYVNSAAFDPALDLFSQFFKCPLFQTETMCREVMAVDAEDSKNRIIDGRRLLQVLKHQIQPHHTYSKFSTGNLKTLVYGDVERYGEHLSNTIRSFHAEYYQPSCMAVALVGPQSVDELLSLAELHFSSIKNNNTTTPTTTTSTSSSFSPSLSNLEEWKRVTVAEGTLPNNITAGGLLDKEHFSTEKEHSLQGNGNETITPTETPFPQECIENASIFTHGGGKLIHFCPIKDIRDLTIIWQLPSSFTLYKDNPCDLISYILNYKGTGSCFAVLQDLKWITALSSDIRSNYEDYTLYETKISLTEHGLLYYNEILSLLNEYIGLMMNTSKQQLLEYWKEMHVIHTLKFQYKQKTTAYELAPALSSNMLDYSMEHILSANYLIHPTIEMDDVRRFLSFLDINKSIIFLRSPEFGKEPHLLGSDNPDYLEQYLYTKFESYWYNNHAQSSSSCNNSSTANSNTSSSTHSHSTSTTTAECSYASLEQLKLSGAYFHRLRAYQLQLMQSHHTQSSATAILPEDVNPSSSVDMLPDGVSSSLCIEPYYGVPYSIQNYTLNTTIKERMKENMGSIELALPSRNTFISTELLKSLHDDAHIDETTLLHSTPPVQLQHSSQFNTTTMNSTSMNSFDHSNTKKGDIWHSRDELFRQPRSIYFHLLHSPSCGDGHPVLSLISQVFSQLNARRLYQPAVAGLHYSLSLGPRGVGLSFHGFSPRLAEFGDTVLDLMHDRGFWTSVEPAVLDMCKDRLLRTHRSWFKERPDSQCESLLRYVLHEGAWLPHHRLAACESIDMPYFQHRVADALLDIRNVLTYAHGSCTTEMANISHNKVLRRLPTNAEACIDVPPDCRDLKASDLSDSAQCWYLSHTERSRILPTGTHNVVALSALNAEDPNSALLTFMQAEISSPAVSARLLLLRRLLSEPAFTELRTKRQLGYIVSLSTASFGRGEHAVRGISVRILSKRFSPLSMELALSEFFQQQRIILNNTVTDEIIAERCQSIIHTLEDPPTSYTEEASDYWDAIVHDLPFDWTSQVIRELKLLDRAEMLAVADRWLFSETSRASLSVMIFSLQHEGEYNALVAARQQTQQSQQHQQKEHEDVSTTTTSAPPSSAASIVDSKFAAGNPTDYHVTIDELVKLRDVLKFQ